MKYTFWKINSNINFLVDSDRFLDKMQKCNKNIRYDIMRYLFMHFTLIYISKRVKCHFSFQQKHRMLLEYLNLTLFNSFVSYKNDKATYLKLFSRNHFCSQIPENFIQWKITCLWEIFNIETACWNNRCTSSIYTLFMVSIQC